MSWFSAAAYYEVFVKRVEALGPRQVGRGLKNEEVRASQF